ncbi:hypothetical protein OU995_11000 [Roseateles sp. SL47]|uniref:hypothetical protein n=1 Tax=Roseateles sp. SL47 TaxID=2995138 RepID=UPI00227071FE|nr:hypothetical protein [Roseateles sp. SL47]WAC75188.1 hypothetical protein OU995_11000 [Roseateles sp. SL47]
MNPLDFPARLAFAASAQDRIASAGGGGAQSFSQAMADVSGIARDMAAERASIANQMRRVVSSGDTSQIPAVLGRLQDANARQDVMATVLTKTTSGIDQIVKMQ